MVWNWQDLVTFALVAVAAGYLLRASWMVLARKKSPGCGTCAKCPSVGSNEPAKQVVTLDLMARPSRPK
jgi:hypothetical protein